MTDIFDFDYSHRQHTRQTGAHPVQTAGIWGTVTGAADWVAGDTDEAVGKAVDSATSGDIAGVGDALAGDFDEAAGQAVDSAMEGDLAGVGDAAAGGVDEAAGGFVNSLFSLDLAGMGDALAGGSDEGLGGGSESEQSNVPSDQRRTFRRRGTPTTDGQNSQNKQNNGGSNNGNQNPNKEGGPSKLKIAGGLAVAGGALALLSKSSGDGKSQKVGGVNTSRNTRSNTNKRNRKMGK